MTGPRRETAIYAAGDGPIRFIARSGSEIGHACGELCARAWGLDVDCTMVFNGIVLTAKPYTESVDLVREYFAIMAKRSDDAARQVAASHTLELDGCTVAAVLVPSTFVSPGECRFHRDYYPDRRCPGSVCDFPRCVLKPRRNS